MRVPQHLVMEAFILLTAQVWFRLQIVDTILTRFLDFEYSVAQPLGCNAVKRAFETDSSPTNGSRFSAYNAGIPGDLKENYYQGIIVIVRDPVFF